MSIRERPGQIIVLEGLDKSGKTTQTNKLYNHLQNRDPGNVFLISFPDYSTEIGKLIKDFLDGRINFNKETLHMLLAANRREKKEIIEDSLKNGNTIIMNRYYQSNLAYGIANGISKEWLLNLDKGIPMEDITIILDVEPVVSQYRAIKNNFDADIFERNEEFLNRARTTYLTLAKEYGWAIVKSNKNKEDVFHSILTVLGE